MTQLRKVLEIGRVNLFRQVRDRGDLFFVFVLPTIIIVALGLQFGGVSRARLGIVSPAGGHGGRGSRGQPRGGHHPVRDPPRRGPRDAPGPGRARPAGGRALDSRRLHGIAGLAGPGQILYLGTTDALTGGLRAPIDAAVARLGAITTAARISVAEGLGTPEGAAAAAGTGYETVPGVEVAVTQIGEPGMFAGFSQFTFGASTQLILFMFLTSMTAAARLVYTRQLGLSRRMTATPTSTWTIVAGEALGRYLVAMMQAAYIVVVTAVVFSVSWGDPLGAGVIIALFGLVAAGFALLVGAMSRNADQAGSLGVFLGLALAALGGCMIPFAVMPAAMQSIARLIPHSWALLGLQELIRSGGGLETVAVNVAVLAVYAAVVMALAAWRFRKAISG